MAGSLFGFGGTVAGILLKGRYALKTLREWLYQLRDGFFVGCGACCLPADARARDELVGCFSFWLLLVGFLMASWNGRWLGCLK